MKTLIVAIGMLASAPAFAQVLNVTEGTRTAEASAFGYDYDFNNGILLKDQSVALSGRWLVNLDADLHDYYGYAVGRGTAVEQSTIDADTLAFTIDVTASTAGNHFQADANGKGTYHVKFDVHEKVRYVATAHVEVSIDGYNTSTVALTTNTGIIFALSANPGQSKSLTTRGWLEIDEYVLDGAAEVFAYGTHGSPDAEQGNATGELQIFLAADYDADGDVDLADKQKFERDYLNGEDDADFQGDGDTDLADWLDFRRTWKAQKNA